MTATHRDSPLLLLAFTSFDLFLRPHLSNGANLLKTCNFDKIYQLGDSLSDTGNLIRDGPIGASSVFASLPYGETYFEIATGRCSNGLLMIDYIDFVNFKNLLHLNPSSPLNGLSQLKEAIEEPKKNYPDTVIVYGDYYRFFQQLFRNAESLGFDGASSQKACCGTGGDYNFNLTKMCGAPGVPVCQNPNEHISWDGVHLTQEAYNIMSGWLLSDILPKLHCPV
ncbi:hypothetical protein Vadar_005868 [Vaccinium darrowii]|uniref:Uncharacterized protein n=1 Tax=Vaccinium darrowii TaxID=229202 RepID=A0ACB7XXW1_9ERIC|nr:hypothetical protein Vadar_005868 [Vaccinium darrowii]